MMYDWGFLEPITNTNIAGTRKGKDNLIDHNYFKTVYN